MAAVSNTILSLKDVKEEEDYIIYSRDVMHKHSKAIGDMLDLFRNHLKVIAEAKKSGREVILHVFADPSLIYACGGIPVDISNAARLSTRADYKVIEDMFQIPSENCPMCKGVMSGIYNNRGVFDKLLLGSSGCENFYALKTYAKEYGYRTYVMEETALPRNGAEERAMLARDHFKTEIDRVGKFINGKGLDLDKLAEEIERANRLCDKVKHLRELQKKHRRYMGALPTMLVLSGRYGYYGQPERYEQCLDNIIAEFESLAEGSYNEDCTEIIWSGVRGVDFAVYVVMDLLGVFISEWTVAGAGDKKYSVDVNPLDSYTDFVLGTGNTGSGGIESECRYVEDLYTKSGASGAFIYITQTCVHYMMGMETRKEYLNARGIPTLALAGTVQVGEPNGQMLTRVKAFIEMISK